ncbi:PRC-barrel domain-containing protein [Corynebacterium pyruviciproducens]|uniref:PRC-barrel domain-containing protein n=1 Tax=Corynebacterium pyruviciproducens TaxID=598660 RepID=UPI00288B447D|nr:PRC-barrel domain-containing protein [Corynebacterium pyruviciproducens]
MGKPDVLQELLRATVVDSQGKKVGRVREVFVDDESKEPSFVEAFRGFLQMKSAFIPLLGYRLDGKKLTVNYSLEDIDSAPFETLGRGMTVDFQNSLYAHYKVIDAANSGQAAEGETPAKTEQPSPAPASPESEDSTSATDSEQANGESSEGSAAAAGSEADSEVPAPVEGAADDESTPAQAGGSHKFVK